MTISALLFRTLALFAAGGVLMVFGSARKPRDVRRARALKFVVFACIVHTVLMLAYVGRAGVAGLAVSIVTVGAVEGFRAWRLVAVPRPTLIAFAATCAAAAFLLFAARLSPPAVAWLYMVSASFDGFGQAFGQLLGRHALAPTISPAKTVEGLAGAFVGSLIVALWLRPLVGFGIARSAATGIAVGTASLVGDLSGSWIKRRAGIKDFSTLLPGQGGVIDRFNSFVVALAIVGAWL